MGGLVDNVGKSELSFCGFLKRRETLDVAVSLWRNVAASVGILGIGLGLMLEMVEPAAMIAAGVVQLIALSAIGISLQLAYLSLRETLGDKYSLTKSALWCSRGLVLGALVLIVGSGYVLLVHFIGSKYWDPLWLFFLYLAVLVVVCLLGLRDWRDEITKSNRKQPSCSDDAS